MQVLVRRARTTALASRLLRGGGASQLTAHRNPAWSDEGCAPGSIPRMCMWNGRHSAVVAEDHTLTRRAACMACASCQGSAPPHRLVTRRVGRVGGAVGCFRP
jgi:hypothetical protein